MWYAYTFCSFFSVYMGFWCWILHGFPLLLLYYYYIAVVFFPALHFAPQYIHSLPMSLHPPYGVYDFLQNTRFSFRLIFEITMVRWKEKRKRKRKRKTREYIFLRCTSVNVKSIWHSEMVLLHSGLTYAIWERLIESKPVSTLTSCSSSSATLLRWNDKCNVTCYASLFISFGICVHSVRHLCHLLCWILYKLYLSHGIFFVVALCIPLWTSE